MRNGTLESEYLSQIYINNGDNTFTASTELLGTEGPANWGDYDNDGYLDILLIGSNGDRSVVSKIYRNNGNCTFSAQDSITLIGLRNGSAAWGDYDNDGCLDLVLTGNNYNFHRIVSKVYHNNENNTFTETSIDLIGVYNSSIAWGDYDNDGDLDILLTGWTSYGRNLISMMYRNNGNSTFTEETSISLTEVAGGSAVFGDYDNDGDLDILLNGFIGDSTVTKIYRNNCFKPNTLPSPPFNLQAVVNGHAVTFSWNRSSDNETPQKGLTYNLAIGTSLYTGNILSPMSEIRTGFRRIIHLGNMDQDTSWTKKGLADGQYYWSVQSVDNNFAGSEFVPAHSFMVQSPGTIIITSPKGGEIWEAGSHIKITYSSLGNSGRLNIDYSIDGGITWDTIATNVIEQGEWVNWTVPNTPSTKCKIRITDADGDPSVISDSLFSIIRVIPVEFVSFTATVDKNKIILNWKTGTELNNNGFEIERRKSGNKPWENIGFVKGKGSTTSPQIYSYMDEPLGDSKFEYRLKQLDINGEYKYSKEVAVEIVPKKFALYQNYPNPFNPSTNIKFDFPEASKVLLNVYNTLGEKIAALLNQTIEAGFHQFQV